MTVIYVPSSLESGTISSTAARDSEICVETALCLSISLSLCLWDCLPPHPKPTPQTVSNHMVREGAHLDNRAVERVQPPPGAGDDDAVHALVQRHVVQLLGFGVRGSGFRVKDSGFGI